MKYSLVLILFSHAFLGYGGVCLLIRLLLSRVVFLKQAVLAECETVDLEPEVIPLIEARLDKLIGQYRLQIPMLSLFLTESIQAKLKQMAKEEVIAELPEIKSRLTAKLSQCVEPESLIPKLHFHFKNELRSLKGMAFLVGLGVGTLDLIILSWIY